MKVLASVAAFGALALTASAASAPVVGANPCTQGPSFWCASAANAEKCEVKTADCKKYCDNEKEYPDLATSEICKPPGSNPCTRGPSYWCASKANAEKCDVETAECKKYCDNEKEYPDLADSEICNPPGSNPCTWGPSYWCASKANAEKCDFEPEECAKFCDNPEEYPDLANSDICSPEPIEPAVGTNPCTYGPSFWCASFANALKCEFNVTECVDVYCANATEYADIQSGDICNATALNLTDCLVGAEFSCASKENADKCGVNATDCMPYCKSKDFPKLKDSELCKETKPASVVGSNKCTQGPSFFCATKENAKACGIKNGAKECSRYCNATEYPELAENGEFCTTVKPVVGSNKCTQGPSFYCASRANAAECRIKDAAEECSRYCDADEYPELAEKGEFCKSSDLDGSNKCTLGPSFFCASLENAEECDVEDADKECSKYCNDEYPEVQKGDFCK